ncbi:MAG: gamma-butyrobetaine dioxygenase [Gammaproteobacteria bacterium]
MYCINPISEGGEAVLVDGFMVSEKLRQRNSTAYRLLASCPQTYHRVIPDKGLNHRTMARALTIDENENLVGFRFHPRALAPTDVGGDLAKQLHSANFALNELVLKEENQFSFKISNGDAVFFDNHRVMHSRKAFDDPERHLQIFNLSREVFHQKVRMTAHELGFKTESQQYLPAGVSG